MKRFCATISLAALVVAASGCGDDALEDCGSRFAWDGVEYHGMGVPRVKLAVTKLGEGTVRGCADEPASAANVFAIDGVDPEVAVAVSYKEFPRDLNLWGRPGYIVESPRHPLHGAVFPGAGEPDDRAGYRCEAPRALRAQVTGLPQPWGDTLRVMSTRGNENVNVDAHTRINGAERHGIPFVEMDQPLRLVVRDCTGADGRLRNVVDALRPAS